MINKKRLVLCSFMVSVLCFNAEVYSQQLPELNLTESDSVLTYTGDANAGMSTSVTFKEQTLTGSYGSVKIYLNGTFDYVASAIHDSLASGSKYSEDFVFTANDDSTLSLTVVINGENDIPAISKLNYVIDASANTNLERASGVLRISDKDAGQSAFVAQSSTVGTYGVFSVQSSGEWDYASNSSQHDLPTGQVISDSFTVESVDGTTRDISVAIHGSKNSAPTVSDGVSHYLVPGDGKLILRGEVLRTGPAFTETNGWSQNKAALEIPFWLVSGKSYRFVMKGLSLKNPYLELRGPVLVGISYAITSPPTKGTATINSSTGAWLYSKGDQTGGDSFTITVTDVAGNTSTIEQSRFMQTGFSGGNVNPAIAGNDKGDFMGEDAEIIFHVTTSGFYTARCVDGGPGYSEEFRTGIFNLEAEETIASSLWGDRANLVNIESSGDLAIPQSWGGSPDHKDLEAGQIDAASQAALVNFGSVKGSINEVGDSDYIKVKLEIEKWYSFEVGGDLPDPAVDLLSDKGEWVSNGSEDGGTGLNATISYKPAKAGDYYVRIYSGAPDIWPHPGPEGAGEYVLKITGGSIAGTGHWLKDETPTVLYEVILGQDVPSGLSTVTEIGVGTSSDVIISGAVDVDSDRDWYKINLEKDIIYQWDLEGVSLVDPALSLRDSSGQILDFNNDGYGLSHKKDSRITYKASVAGVYYLEAYSNMNIDPNNAGLTAGSFNLKSRQLFDDYGGYLITDGHPDYTPIDYDFSEAGYLQAGRRFYGNSYSAIHSYIDTPDGGMLDLSGNPRGDYDYIGIDLLSESTYSFELRSIDPGAAKWGGVGDTQFHKLSISDSQGHIIKDTMYSKGLYSNSVVGFTPDEDGYYFLRTEIYGYSGVDDGDFMIESSYFGDDYAASRKTKGRLYSGETIRGKLEAGGDVDWVQVNLVAGQRYKFTSGATINGERLFLYGPGEVNNLDVQRALNWGGRVEDAYSKPDIGQDAASSHPFDISFWDASGGKKGLITEGDKDWYSVVLTKGEVYQVNLVGRDAANHPALEDPQLKIYDNEGVLVSSGGGDAGVNEAHEGTLGKDCEVYYTAPYTGTFYFEVSAETSQSQASYANFFNKDSAQYSMVARALPTEQIARFDDASIFYGDAVSGEISIVWVPRHTAPYFLGLSTHWGSMGEYQISMEKLSASSGADLVGSSVSDSTPIAFGNTTTTTIDYGGDRDWYKVELIPGESYGIELQGDGVVGGNGEVPRFGNQSPSIIIRDRFGKIKGYPGKWDYKRDAGIAGGRWSGGGRSTFSYSTSLDWLFPGMVAETYYLDVNANLPGDITFTITHLFDDQKESHLTTGVLNVGDTASGTWEDGVENGPNEQLYHGTTPGDGDWYKMDFIAGRTYKVDIFTDILNRPSLALYREDGGYLFPNDQDGWKKEKSLGVQTIKDGHAQLTYTANRTGAFFVSAYNKKSWEGGNNIYDLSLVHIADDVASSLATSATLKVNGQINGNLQQFNDRDWFQIKLDRGSVYKFDLTGTSLKDPTLRVRDSHGKQLYYNDQINGWWNPSITYTAHEDGVFYVDVGGIDSGLFTISCAETYTPPKGDDVFIGTDLELTASVATDSVESALSHSIGNIVQGEITLPGDRRWYKVRLKDAHTYEFQLFGDSMQSPSLLLRNSAGGLANCAKWFKGKDELKSSGEKIVFTWLNEGDGDYYLDVGGYWAIGSGNYLTGVATGTFSLKSTDLGLNSYRAIDWDQSFADASSAATLLGVGASTSGSIENAANRNLYKLSLVEGAAYTFRVSGGLTDGTLDLGVKSRLYLHGLEGGLIKVITDNDLTYKAPSTAVYYMALGATTGQETGNKFRANTIVPFSYTLKAIQERAPRTEPAVNWISTLNDAPMLNLVIAAMEDSVFTRAEVIGVLDSIKDGGLVDGGELSDLRIIVANYKEAGLSNYLATILDNIANGDPANQYYTGKDSNNNGMTARQELGNMYANSSSDRLEKLISKWVLGTDSPATPGLYVRLDLPLFFNGAGTDDVRQGNLGDCYYLSSISAIADTSVGSIDGTVASVNDGDMIVDNGDGTFGVRFYDNNGAERWVTVDKFIPGYREDKLEFASTVDGESWAMLLEKAYVQLNESGRIAQDGINRYGIGNNFGIAGGSAGYALSHITGQKSSYVFIDGDNASFTSETLRELINKDLPLVFSTQAPCPLASSYGVQRSHTYTFESYDIQTQKFHLRNAWGHTHADVTFAGLQVMGSNLHYLDGTKTKLQRINPEESAFSATDGAVGGASGDSGLVPVESNGVKLYKDSQNRLYAGDTPQGSLPVTINGKLVSLVLNGRTAIAAESVGGFNQILWNNDSSGDLRVINFNKSWQFVPSNNSAISAGSAEFNAAQIAFGVGAVSSSTETQTLSLKAGWNLVSFYVEASDMTAATVLAPISSSLLQIKNLTSSYDPSIPSFLNTLSSLSVKDGYWLKVNSDVSLDVDGTVPSGASISVKSGWNLVGYPRSSGESAAGELTSLGSTIVQIKNLTSSYDPSIPSFLNTLSTMVPGSGYWLKVSADGTWTVGTVSDSGSGRGLGKMGPVQKMGWGPVVVYPHVSATVLSEVSVGGKPVSKGSVVGAFVGEELRGEHEVVLANGKSYGTLNVNLTGKERVTFRIREAASGKEYRVAKVMELGLGETYGRAEELVKLNAVMAGSGVSILSYTRSPFGFSFDTGKDKNYAVEATDDLLKWKPLKTLDGTGSAVQFTDTRKALFEKQYYRVKTKQ